MLQKRWPPSKIARESCLSEPNGMRETGCALASKMRESASHLKARTKSFKLSIQRKKMEWESDCLSAAPLSRFIMEVYGQQSMMGQELHFRLLSLADSRAGRTSKLVLIGCEVTNAA